MVLWILIKLTGTATTAKNFLQSQLLPMTFVLFFCCFTVVWGVRTRIWALVTEIYYSTVIQSKGAARRENKMQIGIMILI